MKTYPTPPCFAPRADTNNLIIEGMLYSTDTFKELAKKGPLTYSFPKILKTPEYQDVYFSKVLDNILHTSKIDFPSYYLSRKNFEIQISNFTDNYVDPSYKEKNIGLWNERSLFFKEGIHNYTVSLWSIFGPLQEFQDKYHFKYFKNITLEEGGEIIYNSLLPKSELYVSNCVNPTGKSISVVEEALQAWSNIANISFVLDEKESILNFYICKTERDELNDLIFYQNNSPLSGATLFFSSSERINTANIYIQPYPPLKQIKEDDPSFLFSVMHEIGHALGLTHPHDCCPYLQPKEYDSTQYTAMSYDNIFFNSKILFPTTPMGLDILAVQHIYGLNLNYNNKDNIYYIDGTRKMFTLWDAGGNDTIYVKSYDGHAQVDIREGKVSIIGETIFFIAPKYFYRKYYS